MVPHRSPKQHQLRVPGHRSPCPWHRPRLADLLQGPWRGQSLRGRARNGGIRSRAGRRAVSVLVRPAQPGWVAPGQELSLHGHDSRRLDVNFTVPSACLGTPPCLEGFEGCRPQDKGFFSTQGWCPRGCWGGMVSRGGNSTAGPCAQDQRLSSARCWQVPGAASISVY